MTENMTEIAARIRATRAALVAAIAGRETELRDLVGDPDAGLVKVVVLAEVVPGVGKVRSRRLLDEMGIAHETRWGDLPPDVAAQLATALSTAGGASPAAER